MTITIPLARIHGPDDLRLDAIAPPVCGPDDLVVRVRECGICGSDLGYLSKGGVMGPGDPMAIGHELWGLVSEVGANITHVVQGDRVVVQPMANDNYIGNGGPEGGFSPSLLVRNAAHDPASAQKLPADLPHEFGALVEPMAVAQHGANRVGAMASDKAVIYGAGPIGLCMVQVLKYRGLEDIVVVDISDSRLQVAGAMGARPVHGEDPQLVQKLVELHGNSNFFGMPMPGSTVFFEATGVRAVFEGMLDVAGPGSRVCLTGLHTEAASLDLAMLLAKEVSIIPAMGYDAEFHEVISMLQSGRVDPGAMVTHHFPLSDIVTAFDTARDTANAVKVIIDCQN